MAIEHSLDIPQNLNEICIFLSLHTIPIFGVFLKPHWCGLGVVWYHQSRLGCCPSRLLCTYPGDRRTRRLWNIGRQLEYQLVWMALLIIRRFYSKSRRQFSIHLLWQYRPNSMHVRGWSWYRYKPFRGNLRGQRWEEVGIGSFWWFC